MKEVAIIGPTASGKSGLALNLAKMSGANILSLDSLSIYKEIDIVSAKPTKEERKGIPHFGIDEVYPNEYFSVERFFEIYLKAKKISQSKNVPLIIVGGTSFYLKALLEGLSPMPKIDQEVEFKVQKELIDIDKAYDKLKAVDPHFTSRITSKDRYRIKKALEIFYQTGTPPTLYFHLHPPIPISSVKIYEIAIDRMNLREKIIQRTNQMIQSGLIDEISYLEKRYGRCIHPMKAIGIKETLDFLDGRIASVEELVQKISTNTARLAKRQQTFNKTQFKEKICGSLEFLKEEIKKELTD